MKTGEHLQMRWMELLVASLLCGCEFVGDHGQSSRRQCLGK
jgi:hypothetical protein